MPAGIIMTPPVLLTAPTPLDVDRCPLTGHADCASTQRHVVALPLSPSPFGVLVAHPPSASTSISASAFTFTSPTSSGTHASAPSNPDCDAHLTHTLTHAIARQWTGAPIRAVLPLPRRARALPHSHHCPGTPHRSHNGEHDVLPNVHTSTTAATGGSTAVGLAPARATWVELDTDTDTDTDDTDTDADTDYSGAEAEEGEKGTNAHERSRYCSYESITAAEGLSAWSFEELRVECYAQSLVARGTKPPPVVQPLLAIPPAFVPRVIPRS